MQSSQKYLHYSTEGDLFSGINHQISNLLSLLAEAALIGRTAVVTPFFLAGKHNEGKPLKVYFDKYLDLSEVEKVVNIIRQDEFDEKYATLPTEKVAYQIPLTTLQKNNTPVLIRTFAKNIFNAVRLRNTAVKTQYETLSTLIRPSASVLAMAHQVLPQLQDYYVVHVRRTDMLRLPWWKFPGLDKGTRPIAIRKRIAKWIPTSSTLYIMTDEYKKGFFDSLKKHYRILTFGDFEELVQLKQEDNFMLYEVEKMMAQQAILKVAMFNEYPESGKQQYSLFDYPRSGTKKRHYLFIGRLIKRYRALKH